MNLDASLTIWLNGLTSNPLIAWKVWMIAEWGPLVFVAVAAWYWWHPANGRLQHRLRRTVAAALLATLLVVIFKEAISYLWFRPRPFLVLPELAGRNLLTDLTASFFSLHTAMGAAFALTWWRHGFRKIGGWLLLAAVAIGLARVAAGIHYPTDVVGGIFFGWLAAVLVGRESNWLKKYLS